MKHAKGDFSREIGSKNYTRVKEYFKENQNETIVNCSKKLNLSYYTVHKHVKKLRKERDGI